MEWQANSDQFVIQAASTDEHRFLLLDQLKKFLLKARIMTEVTTNHRIDHAGLRLFYTPPFHAIVLGFQKDGQALGFAESLDLISQDDHRLFLDVRPRKHPVGYS